MVSPVAGFLPVASVSSTVRGRDCGSRCAIAGSVLLSSVVKVTTDRGWTSKV
jgi:hypothetical protein